MELLTKRAKVLEQKPMSFMERLYLPAILKRENCTACGLCAVACPAEAITMEAAERQPNEEHLYREEKYAAKYEINMLRCIFCGLCEEACPKDAIYLSETFAPSNFTRKGFVYSKEELLIPNPKTDKENYELAKGSRAAKTQNN